MDTIKAPYRRKQYLVAKKFQLKYVGLILLLMFMTAALCGYVVYYTSMLGMGEKLANVYPQGRLVSIVKVVNFRIMASLLLVTPLVALVGIYLSHKIAGPVYRMESFMTDVASGNLSLRITLRSGDELTSLANGINRIIDSLREVVSKEKVYADTAASELYNLRTAIESQPQDVSEINTLLKRLAEAINNIKGEIEKYKL